MDGLEVENMEYALIRPMEVTDSPQLELLHLEDFILVIHLFFRQEDDHIRQKIKWTFMNL